MNLIINFLHFKWYKQYRIHRHKKDKKTHQVCTILVSQWIIDDQNEYSFRNFIHLVWIFPIHYCLCNPFLVFRLYWLLVHIICVFFCVAVSFTSDVLFFVKDEQICMIIWQILHSLPSLDPLTILVPRTKGEGLTAIAYGPWVAQWIIDPVYGIMSSGMTLRERLRVTYVT